MKIRNNKRNLWKTYLLLTAGTFFMAVGINVIYEPLSMVTGGFSGIGILVKKMTQTENSPGISVGFTTLVLNIPLFILAFKIKGGPERLYGKPFMRQFVFLSF